MPRSAKVDTPILGAISERWSPRSFDASSELSLADLSGPFEAARWAPSGHNAQPWRFIVGFRGDAIFDQIAQHLGEFNRIWAPRASALVVNIAVIESDEGKPHPWAIYDLGQAVSLFSVQARAEGLYCHQMGGIDAQTLAQEFDLPRQLQVVTVTAVGALGSADDLPEALMKRERAERSRLGLSELILGQSI